MLLAALIDAGCPLEVVGAAVATCGVEASVETEEVWRAGVRGRQLRVGQEPGDRRRQLDECLAAIDASGLAEEVRGPAAAVLTRLAGAEARVHGIDPAQVHLHELAATDTLVDVVGVCAALAHLGVRGLRCSPLPAAPGSVDGAHGRLPLPAPATLALLAEVGAPLVPGVPGVEQVTPTAAALLAELCIFEAVGLRLRAVGHGAGSRDDALRPNLVRCWLGDPLEAPGSTPPALDDCVELRTNLDDTAPAVVAALAARCLEAGALDAWVVPAVMKKGRPGHVLHALVARGGERALAELLLAEMPTLGVRMTPASRLVAGRDTVALDTDHGRLRVKRKWLDGSVVDARPELDDVLLAARRTGVPIQRVLDAATDAARRALVAPGAGDSGAGRDRR